MRPFSVRKSLTRSLSVLKPLTLAVLIGCSPTYHLASRGKCPTTTMLLADFFVASAALVVSAIKASADKRTESVLYTGLGVGILTTSTISELRCRPAR